MSDTALSNIDILADCAMLIYNRNNNSVTFPWGFRGNSTFITGGSR